MPSKRTIYPWTVHTTPAVTPVGQIILPPFTTYSYTVQYMLKLYREIAIPLLASLFHFARLPFSTLPSLTCIPEQSTRTWVDYFPLYIFCQPLTVLSAVEWLTWLPLLPHPSVRPFVRPPFPPSLFSCFLFSLLHDWLTLPQTRGIAALKGFWNKFTIRRKWECIAFYAFSCCFCFCCCCCCFSFFLSFFFAFLAVVSVDLFCCCCCRCCCWCCLGSLSSKLCRCCRCCCCCYCCYCCCCCCWFCCCCCCCCCCWWWC